MTADTIEIRIEDLSKDDALDIEERAGAESVRSEEVDVPAGSHGEPVLFALTLLTAAALRGYVAHLKYKAAILPTERVRHTITVLHDGEVVAVHDVTFERRPDETFSDAVARELAAIPGLKTLLGQLAA